MNRFVYALYAVVVVLSSSAINSGLSNWGNSSRGWGHSSGFSTGSGSSWGGGGHK